MDMTRILDIKKPKKYGIFLGLLSKAGLKEN
jgi:hypothetical protein